MNTGDKISVIVTVYNRFEYVRNILLSLMNQTVQPDEVIFADDGSKDNLGDYLKDLIKDCTFKVKHVWQEDIGFRLARSRNNGAKTADGDFLIFLDQDMIMPDDFIEEVYKNRKEKRIIFIRGYQTTEQEKNRVFEFLAKNEYNYDKIFSLVYREEELKKIKRKMKKDKLYRILYWLKLRSRGAKMVGMMFSLYKDDFIAINGFDSLYKGWGQEDDDFGNRFYKYGGEAYSMSLDKQLLHICHPFTSSKKEDLNVSYYRKRKKEINKNNYRCEHGYYNSIDDDKVYTKTLN